VFPVETDCNRVSVFPVETDCNRVSVFPVETDDFLSIPTKPIVKL
jgi:hypothetical protein